ncbi:unnamed protein product, partial [marine sediment metagenome]
WGEGDNQRDGHELRECDGQQNNHLHGELDGRAKRDTAAWRIQGSLLRGCAT